jgi:hypothetical protein
MTNRHVNRALRWTSGTLGAAAAVYAGYAAVTWLRYGHPSHARGAEADPLLDRFMPVYDVVERHHVAIDAPADVAFAAACQQDLMGPALARAIFKTREIVLGSEPAAAARPQGVLAFTTSMGWGVLAEVPNREVVVGAITQPWEANVVFRPLSPDTFAAFEEPGYVKIVWTLRADPIGGDASIFRTETRAVATDATARTRFRRYWSLLSPGIILIRWAMLRPLKADAERRARLDARVTAQETPSSSARHAPQS